MSFFHNNPLIELCHRITHKPMSIVMWLFTGLVVASTFSVMLTMPAPRDGDEQD
ncbi:HDL315Wp [Eremothecium sinecaudum]|uniref:HDL315Wp n=1 Tax=Eremothecium sinecaudum TaxID=45286 RepID=A0A0X8HS25_9SACH|nr:HDL315Wp [Eremothecium sinecaudum]AMD20429.1 HDL315Wp [Eremothecium sinecaudum]